MHHHTSCTLTHSLNVVKVNYCVSKPYNNKYICIHSVVIESGPHKTKILTKASRNKRVNNISLCVCAVLFSLSYFYWVSGLSKRKAGTDSGYGPGKHLLASASLAIADSTDFVQLIKLRRLQSLSLI